LKGLLDLNAELDGESKLRHDAEDTLRQAQKMEAVGQLTGGIAHDFNNLLTIIIGNLDNMKRQIAQAANPGTVSELSAKLSKSVDAALQGARSAGQLTQRLLAFSRRQALEPQRLDVNRLVSGMLDMLRRTLGAEISIETVLGAGLWPAFADGHQLENVILNLALNAKDAMPQGGCLTVETANTYLDAAYARRFGDVEAGQICGAVRDGYRDRHPEGDHRSGIRAVFHYQAGRRGLGPRSLHGARFRQAVRRSRAHL
jgi:signal transduction histidine kinase